MESKNNYYSFIDEYIAQFSLKYRNTKRIKKSNKRICTDKLKKNKL